jgi:putative membrane protein
VPDLTVRPTAKFIKAGVVLAGILFLALEFVYFYWLKDSTPLLMALPVIVFLWPASRAARRQFTRAVISGDRLRYESGLMSKSTRTIQLSKVQDVRVDQRVVQRLFNVGDLSIETAGETSRLSIPNVDDAQALADEILNRSQRGAAQA